MKLLYIVLGAALVLSCKPDAKSTDKVPASVVAKTKDNFQGVIHNGFGDSLVFADHIKATHKWIHINKDGSFSKQLPTDSLGDYDLTFRDNKIRLHLTEKSQLIVEADADRLVQTLKFTGAGADKNNFWATVEHDKLRLSNALPQEADEQEISKAVDTLVAGWQKKLEASGFDNFFKMSAEAETVFTKGFLVLNLQKRYVEKGLKGKPSPLFSYKDVSGKTVNLSDLKGKYVYIDIWATWCEPCMMQMPNLKNMEKAFAGKNIVFVSISIDKQKDIAKWKKVVAKEQLGGIQLIADKAWDSSFIKDYGILSIPRFILINPEGTVLLPNAEHPGHSKLMKQLHQMLD